ncbi:ABC transporter substrate-binding protein [Homoserinibacter sp. YIM 151385]|uniref:ABC transporter substrate-binding protein n=1 Tax=Homoserinibacter sp. YIM 151385 TaxID=2985506 RepID=UPI0022F01FD1|nr:ABC transporter substrate-binding protein [Homoserinibacter sp. YIM 151385]WBU38972.1 ABC transporter substrate-binding protein [Homoserinibacter sp. YIM 151385]
MPALPASRSLPLAGATAIALLLAGCGGAANAGPGDDAKPVEGGTIVYAHQQEPACVFGGWIEQAYLSYNVLDNLTSLGEDGVAVPWLAESWEESEDGLAWTFHLKPDVEFTDGTPVDAEAVAANVEFWLAGGNSTAVVWLEDAVAGAEAVGELDVELELRSPYPRLAETVSQGYFGIQSQQALETRSEEENCEQPIGSGAFTVGEWKRGESIQLIRNDDYTSWPANAKHEGPAKVEGVDWRFVADPTTRVAALRSDEADAIYDVPAIEWAGLDSEAWELHRYVTAGRPQQLSFNTQEGPFTDERVRQAFAYSLDRDAIVETVGRGVIPVEGNGGVSRSTPGWSEDAANRYDYDPEQAAELLDGAGWTLGADGIREKDGEPLSVILPYGAGSIINTDGASILQGVQQQAKETGFDVELIPVPQSAFFGGAYSKPSERDINAGYWTAVTSGILRINWKVGTQEKPNFNNAAFSDDAELEAIIAEADATSDIEEQNALYAQAQELIADKAYSIGLYDRLSTLAVSPFVKDVWQEHAQGGPVFHDAYFVE